jgi:hypothetical protein
MFSTFAVIVSLASLISAGAGPWSVNEKASYLHQKHTMFANPLPGITTTNLAPSYVKRVMEVLSQETAKMRFPVLLITTVPPA